jgi:hypothetical protein
MSQRGNKVFFDKCETVFDGDKIAIATGDASTPTTFNTNNSTGALVIANEWNGVTINNGIGDNPDLCFGPNDNFYAQISAQPGSGFMVKTANNADIHFFVNDAGNAHADKNLSVGRGLYVSSNVTVNGQIRSVGPAGSRAAVTYAGAAIEIDLRNGSFAFIQDNIDNTVTCKNFEFGDHLYLQLNGRNTEDVTFTTGFAVSNQTMNKKGGIISFICDGDHMVEVSRGIWDGYVSP